MIHVNTLGGLSVRDGDKPLAGPATQPRRLAILALLARSGDRGMSRDKMLALLWPDADDERGPRTLAQALYALRKNLAADDAITGAKELRFDPALVTTDVAEFSHALARGDASRAVAVYGGPFLDGFHLTGADEFTHWVEQERSALALEYSRALESLAREALAAGDARTSVSWWRKLAGLEPLNARVAVGLMEALALSGDRAAAIQHARLYEALVEQELDLPPDNEVLSFARRLRDTGATRDAIRAAALGSEEPIEAPAPPIVERLTSATEIAVSPKRARSRWATIAIGAVAAVVAGALVVRGRPAAHAGPPSGGPVVAIGRIASFGTDSAGLAAPIADLLTTSLARATSLRVVSHGRMLELMHSLGSSRDTSERGFDDAARQAGATEVLEGTLFAKPGGRLRLDLRRVDLSTGAIDDVHTVEGNDVFSLVDSGTAQLVVALGAPTPAGSIADVTTRSVTAYRMYEKGIRAYYQGDLHTALGFFDAALGEDSLFALAAYYGALSNVDLQTYVGRIERAKRLAERASDRERLTILAGWASATSSPSLRAIADTLATRYPTETEGHLYSGIARVAEGDFLAALEPLQRVVSMDSLGLRGDRPRCNACEALDRIVGAYQMADSLPAAEREARRWHRLQPTSRTAIIALTDILESEDRGAEADSLLRATIVGDKWTYGERVQYRAFHLIRARRYAAADSLLRIQLRDDDPQQQADALWNLTISLREQGRLREAVAASHRIRAAQARLPGYPEIVQPLNPLEAQALREAGQYRMSAALFDSLAHQHGPNEAPSLRARQTAWMLAQSAGARFDGGDTSSLARLADSIRTIGEQSGYGRDRRLYHHVRGLMLAARGDDAGAIDELTSAIYSISAGYTRTNYELARAYLRAKRPNDAVAVLQPPLHGPLDASNLYLNRIELEELLAQAWDSAAQRDSALAHYLVVARTWADGDASFRVRAERATARAAQLRR